MPYVRNAKKPWTRKDIRALKQLARENTPLVTIAFKLGRTRGAVRVHAAKVGASLRKRNLRPYGQ